MLEKGQQDPTGKATIGKFQNRLRVRRCWASCALLGALSAAALAQLRPRVAPELGLQTGDPSGPIAFSPDEQRLATGSVDGSLKLWDLSTGLQLRTLSTGGHQVEGVAFSPDGRLLATAGGSDQSVKLWDAESGQELRTLSCSRSGARGDLEVIKVAFSSDGQLLTAANNDTGVTIWEVSSGKQVSEFRSSAGLDRVVDVAPDARQAATAAADFKSVELWDLTTGNKIRTLQGHSDSLRTLLFSHDGRHLASGGDLVAKVWDVASGQELYSLPGNEDSRNFAFSRDGVLLARAADKTIKIYEAASGRERVTINGDSASYIRDVAFSPSGRWLASVIYNPVKSLGLVKVWDVATGREVRALEGYTRGVEALAFDRTSGLLAVGNRDLTVNLWDIGTGREMHTFPIRSQSLNWGPMAVAFSSDGRWLASSDTEIDLKQVINNTVTVREVATGQEIQSIMGFNNSVVSITFSPDGKLLAASDYNGGLRILDTATWGEDEGFKIEQRSLSQLAKLSPAGILMLPRVSVAFSPDGRWLAIDRPDAIVIWNVAAHQIARTIDGTNIRSFAFSPDSKKLASVDQGALKISICEVETGNRLADIPIDSVEINKVAFSPDSRWLAAAGEDHVVRLLDVVTGRELRNFVGHAGAVKAVVFSPDGRWLFSGSDDGSVRVWEPSTGAAVALLSTINNSENWIVVTNDGLFDGSPEGTQKLVAWRMGGHVYPPDRFFTDYYTPGLLAKLFAGEHPTPQVDLAALKLPPEVHVSSSASGSAAQQQRISVAVEAVDRGGGIGEVRLYQNGKLVGVRSGTAEAKSRQTFEVDLVPGENVLKAVGFSKDRVQGNDDVVQVVLESPALKKPDLHVLAVGINEYEDPRFDLDFAQPDAQSLAQFFQKHDGLFNSADVVTLLSKEATKANIQHALDDLAERAKPEDVVLVYLAGHGVGLGEQFYFLPHEMRTEMDEEAAIRKYGIPASVLGDALLRMKALKQILILDTCESEGALPLIAKAVMFRARGLGSAEEKAVKMLARSQGVYLIAASTKQQYAYEVPELGHGLLTYALLSGLGEKGQPQAPTTSEGIITVYSLLQYVNQSVPELTEKYHAGEKQYPVSSNTGQDFPLWLR